MPSSSKASWTLFSPTLGTSSPLWARSTCNHSDTSGPSRKFSTFSCQSSCPVGVLNIPLPLTVPLTLGQSPTQRTSHLSLSLSRLPRRKNKSQPSALCSFPFMSTLPSLSRKPSYSSDPEEKDGGYIDPKELNDIELARMPHPTSHKPLWKRMLTGDAHYAFDTHRAMSSRHITMIGMSN